MSFNPFKKKTPEGSAPMPNAPDGGTDAAATDPALGAASAPVGSISDDKTDPLGDAHTEPTAAALRDGAGGRVEIVAVGDDRFLRLTIADARRADLLRPLLMDLPESSSGFRDLLVADDAQLAAAFDLPETNLSELAANYRALDIIDALSDVATLLAACAKAGLVWPEPAAELIGLTAEQAHRAEGYRRWRATFAGWDQLAPGEEAAAARTLARLFMPPLDALLSAAQQHGFTPAHAPLALLLGALEQLAESASSYAQLAAVRFGAGLPTLHAATDTGRRREHNEDGYALLTLEQASVAGSRFTLAAVADGMGGHNSGEVASSLALDLLRTQLAQLALSPRLKLAEPQLGAQLEQIVPAISRALNERAAMDAALGGMGTTLAGYVALAPQSTVRDVALPAAQGAVFWVGDSRAYLLAPDGLRALSVDHSYVQSLVDQGQVSRTEAFTHPQKNIITRCLGASGQDDRPEVAPFTLGPGELLLVCSDGLTDALREEEVWSVACNAGSTELAEIAAALIAAANAAGGPDNITVALVSL
jgi:PPM family protein phosphatase